jgi:addiction module RelE/StbE family toxin
MQIEYHRTFRKRFPRLPSKVKEQFYERLELFMRNKFEKALNNHSVGAAYPGCRSINVTGDYRAIYSEASDIIIFITIGTHSQLY